MEVGPIIKMPTSFGFTLIPATELHLIEQNGLQILIKIFGMHLETGVVLSMNFKFK